jgi:hypothetical protein
VIELPPFAEAGEPPPWRLPAGVLSGRLDTSHDWFATTPVAVYVEDGKVISAREGEDALRPDFGMHQTR